MATEPKGVQKDIGGCSITCTITCTGAHVSPNGNSVEPHAACDHGAGRSSSRARNTSARGRNPTPSGGNRPMLRIDEGLARRGSAMRRRAAGIEDGCADGCLSLYKNGGARRCVSTAGLQGRRCSKGGEAPAEDDDVSQSVVPSLKCA